MQIIFLITTFFLTTFFFIPFSIYAPNSIEFSTGFFNILQSELIFIVPAAILSFLVVQLVPRRLKTILICLLLSLMLGCYIQSNYLFSAYGLLDGNEIEWEKFYFYGILDIVVWIIIFLAIFRNAEFFIKHLSALCSFILILQSLNFIFIAKDNEVKWQTEKANKVTANLYRYSKDKNVVFILLDAFESPAFAYISKKYPEILDTFKDFTYFHNTLALFPTTAASVPAILSGQAYNNIVPINDFLSKALPESLPSKFKQAGFDVSLVTLEHYCRYVKADMCLPLDQVNQKESVKIEYKEAAKLNDLMLFRVAPQFFKRLIYNDQLWFLQSYLQSRRGPGIHVNSIEVVEAIQRNASADADKPTFKFYHLQIPHPPIALDAECNYSRQNTSLTPQNFSIQARCALHLVSNILDKFKQLGVYDNSLIIVLADHGLKVNFGHYTKEKGQPEIAKALPLLLIKPAGVSTEFNKSAVPAQLSDLPKTVAKILALEFNFPGQDIYSLKEDTQRERKFNFYTWKNEFWKHEFLPPMTEYIVNGNAWDMQSWKKKE